MTYRLYTLTLKKDKETRRQGDVADTNLLVFLSPCLPVSRWLAYFLPILLALALAGCGFVPTETTVQGEQTGGSDLGPDTVARNFFEDLQSALEDPELGSEDNRGQWVERLANYFAPNERDDQRIALRSALDSFVAGQRKLDPNEKMTIELRLDGVETLSESGARALVRPVNGSIYILITRATDTGVATIWEQNEPLAKIVGNPDGAVPVVRIGRTWYLTEG